jgi:putative integral membrane protein (TIGR02587 family)
LTASRHANREYAVGLARAFGGAILFGFPLLMTMEMWWFGFHLDRLRLLLFLALDLALLVGLTLFGLLGPGMPLSEIVGKIAVQAVPASIGAAVAVKQLGSKEGEEESKERSGGYVGQLFLMLAGALFLAFNVAPTDEMALIAFKMTPWHALALAVVSILLLHAFVYTVGFSGQVKRPEDRSPLATFLHYTVAGYGIALIVSLYVLWTFGRTEDAPFSVIAGMTVVLAFPAALGAAIARLIV